MHTVTTQECSLNRTKQQVRPTKSKKLASKMWLDKYNSNHSATVFFIKMDAPVTVMDLHGVISFILNYAIITMASNNNHCNIPQQKNRDMHDSHINDHKY